MVISRSSLFGNEAMWHVFTITIAQLVTNSMSATVSTRKSDGPALHLSNRPT